MLRTPVSKEALKLGANGIAGCAARNSIRCDRPYRQSLQRNATILF